MICLNLRFEDPVYGDVNIPGVASQAFALSVNGAYHHFAQYYDQRPSLYAAIDTAPYFMLLAEIEMIKRRDTLRKWQTRSLFKQAMETIGQNDHVINGVVGIYKNGLQKEISRYQDNLEHLIESAKGATLHSLQLKIGPVIYDRSHESDDLEYLETAFSINMDKILSTYT